MLNLPAQKGPKRMTQGGKTTIPKGIVIPSSDANPTAS